MNPLSFIDISVSVDEKIPVWPGTPPVTLRKLASFAQGDPFEDTLFSASVHTGTHIDAPRHFIPEGQTVDAIPLERLIGPARVVEIFGAQEITADHLAAATQGGGPVQRLLIKTDNDRLWQKTPERFVEDFAALKADAAQWIVDQNIQLVGIDYFSIQRFSDGPQTHQILLQAGVVILETLQLHAVMPGEYQLVCLPIKIRGAEAAPVRALLFSNENV